MILKEIAVKKQDGIGSADAQVIVRCAMRYESDIFFDWRTRKVNAKSIMGVIAMGLNQGDRIMVVIKGDDENEALSGIESLFAKNFKI